MTIMKGKKKILILSQYFYPENFRINDLIFSLPRNKYEISVLTGKPNYPLGKVFHGYNPYTIENYKFKNIFFTRIPIIPRKKNIIFLVLNYLSFVLSAGLYCFFIKKKYDFIFVPATSPITSALPAIILKRRLNAKLILWVQDIWPDIIKSTGKIKSKIILNLIDKIVKFIYSNSDSILIQCKSFKKFITRYKLKSKIEYFPFWSEKEFKYMKKKIANHIICAGNIGSSMDLDLILKFAKEIKYKKLNYKLIFYGDGSKKFYLKKQIINLNLEDILILKNPVNKKKLNLIISMSKFCLLSLKNDPVYNATVPGRFQTYLSCGKPIICLAKGITSKIIRNNNLGFVVNNENLNQIKSKFYIYNRKKINSQHKISRRFYLNNYSKNFILSKFYSF